MKKLLTVSAAILVSACASQPDEIHTTQVSNLQYQTYDCEQLGAEAVRVSDRANDLRRSLKETADNDAAQVGVGLILFWPALFLVEGGDGAEANEYARLKGEKEAIERVSVIKKCAVNFTSAPTLQAASTAPNAASYSELEKPKSGDEIDGRLLAYLLQKNTAKGSLFNCDLSGNTIRETVNEVKIQFHDQTRASVRIVCDYSHGAGGLISEDMDVKWKIKRNELCFYDVPETSSSFSEDCNPVVLSKYGYDLKGQNDGGVNFVLEGSGMPSSTTAQIDRAFSRIKPQS